MIYLQHKDVYYKAVITNDSLIILQIIQVVNGKYETYQYFYRIDLSSLSTFKKITKKKYENMLLKCL